MSSFFAIDPDVNYPGRWFLGEPTAPSGDEVDFWQFTNGRKVTQQPTGFTYPVQDDGVVLDITIDAFDVPIISKKAHDFFSCLGDDQVQTFPVEVRNKGKFYILNICSEISAIDMAGTKLDYFPAAHPRVGKIRTIYTLKVKAEGVPRGLDIFRLKGYEVQVIISRELKDRIESLGLTGLVYRPV